MNRLLFALFLIAPAALIAQGKTSGVAMHIEPQVGGGHMCLDANANRDQDGTPIAIFSCHEGLAQQLWTVTASVDNKHAIIGVAGYCLDVRGVSSTHNGTPAQLYKCHFGANQRFVITPDGRITEVQSGKCLIAPTGKDGTSVVLDTCQKTPGEIWTLVPTAR